MHVLVDGAHGPGMVAVDLGAAAGVALLRRQLPQVDLRAEGQRRSSGCAVTCRPACGRRDQPRRVVAAHRPEPLPARVRLDRHHRPDRLALRPGGDRATRLVACRAAGRSCAQRNRALALEGRRASCARRSASTVPCPDGPRSASMATRAAEPASAVTEALIDPAARRAALRRRIGIEIAGAGVSGARRRAFSG